MKPLFSNIVVAISGSNASIMAAKYAIIMAKTYRCKMSAVYVVDTATIKQLTLSKIFVQQESIEYEQSLEANGMRYLRFVEELAYSKGIKTERELRKGAVSTEILCAADEKQADIIMLGSWEKDRSARDIIGQSHHQIMENAKCSVLLVKEPDIDMLFKRL
ncbi:MAG: universal stress protein [Treponema sp.]|jgi:nucleotide-binding universal stress UspA family protein|nr:universal stress protein [Treponema sp.]